VIEVGIDQPRATLLIVENAERFGLSQLHQLRGRVGRSSLPSFCILMSDSDDPLVRRRLVRYAKAKTGLRLRKKISYFAVRETFLVLSSSGSSKL